MQRRDAGPLLGVQLDVGDGVEVWPVNHVFRAGSALRMYVESPASVTGFRQLLLNPTPAENTIHVGPDTPTEPSGLAPLNRRGSLALHPRPAGVVAAGNDGP